MLAETEALEKPLCSFLSFLSLDSLYNRRANISGPIDGDERHPLSQSIVNLHRDCPHRRHYPPALPKYGLIDLTLAFPTLSQGILGDALVNVSRTQLESSYIGLKCSHCRVFHRGWAEIRTSVE